MVASRSARERKAQAEAGELARVKIDLDAQDQFVYKIACTSCTVKSSKDGARPTPWSVYRSGADNGFMAAMDRWIFHLVERHPDVEAPCLAYLGAAQQRLHERRAGAEGPE